MNKHLRGDNYLSHWIKSSIGLIRLFRAPAILHMDRGNYATDYSGFTPIPWFVSQRKEMIHLHGQSHCTWLASHGHLNPRIDPKCSHLWSCDCQHGKWCVYLL